MPDPTLRELSRRAIRQRLGDVAIRIFAERGYAATTVDEVAAAAGISERTFFRYFGTKDQVLFFRADEDTQMLVDRLRERPVGEAPWISLRQIVLVSLDLLDDEAELERERMLRSILNSTPELLAHQLARVADTQRTLGDALWERWIAVPGHREDDADTRLVLRALVGAMLGVLTEVMMHAEDQPPAERRRLVRTALDAIRPGRVDLGGEPDA
ncbi:TetR family transcriptional regulator [Microbacterium sp.]|uniref:TetR family transcriptional regulator n=1 Tax=Microbacterium sp. TaxID=51671 RepID=UPI0033413EC4